MLFLYDVGNPGPGLGQAQKYRTIVLAIDQENGRYLKCQGF
jgi:hypothetical protein